MEFDTEKFILCIKDMPCIWDSLSDDYSNRELKKKCWEELTLLFGGGECGTSERNALCTSLQKKWRNIKDSFVRENRRMKGAKSGSAATRKSPYVYYNLLSFLNSTAPPPDTQSSIESIESQDIHTEPGSVSQRGPYETRILAKKKKPQDHIGEQLINVLKESTEERRKRDFEQSQDEDRMFLLSLVGEFKRIPQHLKLSAKRQVICAIEQFQSHPNVQNVTEPAFSQQYNSENNRTYYSQGYSTAPTEANIHTMQQSPHGSDARSPLLSCFDNIE